MNSEPQPSSLRDYIDVLRRRKWLMMLLIIVGAAVAFGLSVTQADVYKTTSSIRVKDPSASLGLVGLLPTQGEAPTQIAAQGAVTVTRPEVLKAVIDRLNLSESADVLAGDVEAAQNAQSNLITVTAQAATASDASQLANTVATEAVRSANANARSQYAGLAKQLRQQAGQIEVPGSGAKLSSQQQQDLQDQLNRRGVLSEQAARLQALSTVAQLGSVAERATTPTSPSAPKPVRNGIIGGIFGLLISLVLVGLLESLDRRLRVLDDVQGLFEEPVVGIVPTDAMGGVPIAGVPGKEHVEAMNAFRMLRTNIGLVNVDRNPKSIMVTSGLAEEGKTTVSIGLALALAASKRRTLLIEADLHRPTHAKRLGLDGEAGLADYLVGDATPQQIVQACNFVDPAQAELTNGAEPAKATLACITAGSRTAWPAELIGSTRFRDFLEKVSDVYDSIVIDTAPLLAASETSEIAALADSVAFCVRLDQTTTDQARAGRDALERLRCPSVSLVVTGADPRAGGYYSYGYSYGMSEARTA